VVAVFAEDRGGYPLGVTNFVDGQARLGLKQLQRIVSRSHVQRPAQE
jgi:hypothetical protein